MAYDESNERIFRSSKRRKIVRRRGESESNDEDGVIGQLVEAEQSEAPITKHFHENNAQEEHGIDSVTRARSSRGVRKQGIGFSSSVNRRHAEQEEHEEMALIPAAGTDTLEVMHSDRFVRPTGRVGLSEDKHMYVSLQTLFAIDEVQVLTV